MEEIKIYDKLVAKLNRDFPRKSDMSKDWEKVKQLINPNISYNEDSLFIARTKVQTLQIKYDSYKTLVSSTKADAIKALSKFSKLFSDSSLNLMEQIQQYSRCEYVDMADQVYQLKSIQNKLDNANKSVTNNIKHIYQVESLIEKYCDSYNNLLDSLNNKAAVSKL